MTAIEWAMAVLHIGLGGYFVVFSRRASAGMFAFQRKVFGIRHTEKDARLTQVLTFLVGAVLLGAGLLATVQGVAGR
jgi:hypothetical protein